MQYEEGCVFCDIIRGDLPSFKVYEDDHTFAFMDINPANPGHALVVPKCHTSNIFEIPEPILSLCICTAQRVAWALKEVIPSDGVNILQANGEGAAQSVLHFHFHVVPRTLGDDLKLNWDLIPGEALSEENRLIAIFSFTSLRA